MRGINLPPHTSHLSSLTLPASVEADRRRMCEDLYYNMARSRLGLATIINNLEAEQEPTKKDVEVMGNVLRDIGST